MSSIVVVYDLDAGGRRVVTDALDGAADTIYLPDLDDAGRAAALRKADAVLARTTRELRHHVHCFFFFFFFFSSFG